MNPFRFTILQLFLVTALVALVAGLVSAAWRATAYQSITHVCFSPSGRYLAASYSSGAVQVWRLDQGRPRLVAKAFGRPGIFNFDYGSSLQFVCDDKLLKVETMLNPEGVRVRQLDITTRRTTDVRTIGGLGSLAYAATSDRLFAWDSNAKISSYRLDSGRVDRSWSFATSPDQWDLTLAANGKTLAVRSHTGYTRLVNVDSDEAPVLINGGSPLAISADGRRVATTSYPQQDKAYLWNLHDPASLSAPVEIDLVTHNASTMTFAPDNRQLVVAGSNYVEYYDLEKKAPVKQILIDDPVPFAYGHLLSPAADRLAKYDYSRIVVHDLSNPKSWHILGGDWHLLEIIIFTLGFAAWSVAWGIIAKRERLKQMACAPRTAPIGVVPLSARPAPVVHPWKRKLIMVGLTLLLSVIALAALEMTEARSLSAAFWQTASWLGTIFVMAAGFVALYATISYLKSGPHHITLLRLKQLTGAPGRLARFGKLTFWFPTGSHGWLWVAQQTTAVRRGSPDPAQAQECLAEILDRAEEVFGRDVEPQKRRIIVCLERQSELDAYFSRHIPLCSLIPRFVLDRVTLVCRETALTQLITPRHALKAGLAFSIVVEQTRGFIAGWVATLLNQQITRDSRRPAEIRSAVRYLKAFIARQPNWDPKAVLLRTPRERMRIWLGLEERHEWRDVHAETNLLLTLGEILLGEAAPRDRAEKVLSWLRTIKPKDDAIATFETQVGVSIETVLSEWRQWLTNQSGLPFDPLPAESRSLLETIALPTIADQRLPIKIRQRMVRQLGCFHVAAVPTLLDLLTDPLIELRREAVDALELLAGQTFGDNAPQWQAWWQTVSASLSEMTNANPFARMITAAVATDQTAVPPSAPAPLFGAGLPTPPNPPTAGLHNAGRLGGQPTWHGQEIMPQLAPSQPPRELKACWGLMVAAGFLALVAPICLMFYTGPIVFPMFYYSLFLGVAALARGASRDTFGLTRIAQLQLFNVMACDPINALAGAIVHFLLRREHVKQYLLTVNAGRL